MSLVSPPSKVGLMESPGRNSHIWMTWFSRLFDFLTDENWHEVGATNEPAFDNSWVNYDSVRKARFRKDQLGMVHLAGIIKTGTVPSSPFTLPEGYRPDYTASGSGEAIFAVTSNNAYGTVLVAYDGVVTVNAGSSTYVSLDGITFKAA